MKMQNPGQSWALAINMTVGSVRERKSGINNPILSCNWDRIRIYQSQPFS